MFQIICFLIFRPRSLLQTSQIDTKRARDGGTIELGESLLQVNQVDRKSRSEENLDLGESFLQVNQVNKKNRDDDTIELGESLLQVDQVTQKTHDALRDMDLDLGESLLQVNQVNKKDDDDQALQLGESLLQTSEVSTNSKTLSDLFKRSKAASKKSVERDEDDDAVELGESKKRCKSISIQNRSSVKKNTFNIEISHDFDFLCQLICFSLGLFFRWTKWTRRILTMTNKRFKSASPFFRPVSKLTLIMNSSPPLCSRSVKWTVMMLSPPRSWPTPNLLVEEKFHKEIKQSLQNDKNQFQKTCFRRKFNQIAKIDLICSSAKYFQKNRVRFQLSRSRDWPAQIQEEVGWDRTRYCQLKKNLENISGT